MPVARSPGETYLLNNSGQSSGSDVWCRRGLCINHGCRFALTRCPVIRIRARASNLSEGVVDARAAQSRGQTSAAFWACMRRVTNMFYSMENILLEMSTGAFKPLLLMNLKTLAQTNKSMRDLNSIIVASF